MKYSNVLKKLSLALMLGMFSIASAFADNKLTVSNIEIVENEQAVVSVLMENDADITSMQVRINLPEGLTLVPIDKDEYGDDIYFKLNQSRTYDPNDPDAQSKQRHEIGFGALYQEDGADKSLVIITHAKNSPFVGQDGEIFSFKVQAGATLADESEITLSDAHFSTTSAVDIVPALENGTVTKLSEPVGIGIFTADDFCLRPGNQWEMILSLENNYDLKAVQFDLHLPQGLSIVPGKEGATTNAEGRMTNSRLNPDANEIAPGTWRITYSNPQSSNRIKLVAGEGPVIGIIFTADNNLLDPSQIVLDNAVLTRPNLKEIEPEPLVITVCNPAVAEKAAEELAIAQAYLDEAGALAVPEDVKNYDEENVAKLVAEAEEAIAAANEEVAKLKGLVDGFVEDGTVLTDASQEVLTAEKAVVDAAIDAAEASIEAAVEAFNEAEAAAKAEVEGDIAALQDRIDNAIPEEVAGDNGVKTAKLLADQALKDLKDALENAKIIRDNEEIAAAKEFAEQAVANLEEVAAAAKDLYDFNLYKGEKKDEAAALAKEDDSDASKKLIDEAKKDIDNLDYDNAKSLDENKEAVDAIVAQLAEDLEAQRAIDAQTVGIVSLKAVIENNAVVYDLNGKRVLNSQVKKGLYIINGKKMMVK